MGPDKRPFVRLLTTYETLCRSSSCYGELILICLPHQEGRLVSTQTKTDRNKKRTLHSIQFQLAFRVLSARLSVNVNFHCTLLWVGGDIKKQITKHKTHRLSKDIFETAKN